VSVLTTFDVTTNFWKMNPQFKIIDPFMTLYKNDRSKGKKDSSKTMWAVVLSLDPSKDNAFRNIPIDERRELIARDYLKKPKFDWEQRRDVIDFYRNQILSQAAKSLIIWEEIMNDREKTLKAMYTVALKAKDISMISDLDKLLSTTPKYYLDYDKIKTAFKNEEEALTRGKGNKIKSLSDGGEI